MLTAFDMAKQHHAAGEFSEAEVFYRQAVDDGREAFKAYNNLGTLLEEQGRVDEAIAAYQAGAELAPDCFLLYYNLAHALHGAQRLHEALLAYLRALQLEPDSFETHYNLGNLLADQGRFSSAVEAYQRALKIMPQSRESWSNLGAAFFEQKQFEEALDAFQQAIAVDPEIVREHIHLGRTFEMLRRPEEAIAAYEQARKLDPTYSSSHAQLVSLLQSLERELETEQAFAAWQQAIPGDPVCEHMWAAYTGTDVPIRASDDYVRAVFDNFATDFDSVLSKLNYRAPQLVTERLKEFATSLLPPATVLDAGCGTGLCGPLLRSLAADLVGVDLSLPMLQKAQQRGCYDKLFEGELTEHLRERSGQYDVIVSADTFCYFGDLRSVLAAAHGALVPHGLLAFTVELVDSQASTADYVLSRHGRYAHAVEYVGLTLQQLHFKILKLESVVLRSEAARPVKGLVVVAEQLNEDESAEL